MHVECSSCKTRYTIADDKIPAQGARVRCRKCQAVFQVERPAAPTPAPLPLIPPTPEETMPAAPPPAFGATPPGLDAPYQAPPHAPSMMPPARPEPSAPAGNPFMPPPAEPASPPEVERFTPAFSAGAQAVAEAPQADPIAPPSPFQEEPTPAPPAPPAPAAPAQPRPVSPYSPSAGIPEGLPEAERLKHERARRFARVLASDIAIYNKEKRDRGVKDGNLVAVLGYEIKKSWEVYKERVTPELANSTPYFRDALNEMLAEGKKVF